MAGGVSLLFTTIATALAFTKIRAIETGNQDVVIPVSTPCHQDCCLGIAFVAIALGLRLGTKG